MNPSSDLPPPLPSSQPPEIPDISSGPEGSAPLRSPRLELAGTSPARDRIVILGRRRAGKTIFLARLYEALWRGCKVKRSSSPDGSSDDGGKPYVKMSCRAISGVSHAQFLGVVADLRAGKWPPSTSGSSYAEIIVTHNGREHSVTALDYPGEVFRKAFMLESDESDAAELRAAVDRAAAAIFLIDPSVVAAGGEEAQEDVFGLTQAALRIRKSPGGEFVPIAVVFTKCDQNAAFLKEAGGVRKFATRHFPQLFREIERATVFPCAAVRVRQNQMGKLIPDAEKPPENVVEPLRYCLDFLERGADVRRSRVAKAERAQALRVAEQAEHEERKKSTMVWIVFAVAVSMLFVAVCVAAFWFAMRK